MRSALKNNIIIKDITYIAALRNAIKEGIT